MSGRNGLGRSGSGRRGGQHEAGDQPDHRRRRVAHPGGEVGPAALVPEVAQHIEDREVADNLQREQHAEVDRGPTPTRPQQPDDAGGEQDDGDDRAHRLRDVERVPGLEEDHDERCGDGQSSGDDGHGYLPDSYGVPVGRG
jgi:hypothetical protein